MSRKLIMSKQIISILDYRNSILEYINCPNTCITVIIWCKICCAAAFRISLHFSPGWSYSHFFSYKFWSWPQVWAECQHLTNADPALTL